MDTEMSSQPHLLICCYLLSSRQYLVQGTHNAEVSTTFITLIPGCTMHAATDQQKQSGLEDLQSSPCPFRLCTNFPWLRCCKVVLERSQGMAMCQWEGFSKEEDVGTHCQSDLPSGLGIQPCTGFLQSHPCTLCSLGGLHSTPCVITLVRLFVHADEALSRIRHLWKSIPKSCQATRSRGANAQLPKSMSQGNQ